MTSPQSTRIHQRARSQHLRRKDIAYRKALAVDVGMRRVGRDMTALADVTREEESDAAATA